MEQYNIHEAKSNLSKLLQKAEKGLEVIISKSGKPVAVLKKYQAPQKPRTPGQLKGKINIADDFDEFGSDLQEMFGLKG